MDETGPLASVFEQVKKIYGENAILRLGDRVEPDKTRISTSCLSLDAALNGGMPRGRIVEAHGPKSAGKSTLSIHLMAEVQRQGEEVAIVDLEYSCDPTYMASLGVNVPRVIIAQPDYGEQALDITEAIIRSGAVSLIVLDSIAAVVPKDEVESDSGARFPGRQAWLLGQFLRKATPLVAKYNCCLFMINQMRAQMQGGGGGFAYGPSEEPAGGYQVAHYSSVRMDVRKIKQLKDDDDQAIGHRVRFKIDKNKVGLPYRHCELDLIYGQGFDRYGDLIDLALDCKIMERSGASHRYQGNMIGRSRARTIEFLRDPENEATARQIEMDVRRAKGMAE